MLFVCPTSVGKVSSLISGPIPKCQGPSPSSPFFHDVSVIFRDCEPISSPQSGSLINHYILGSTKPSRMLHITVLFCSLIRDTLLQRAAEWLLKASVTWALYPLGFPASSRCMARGPEQLKLSFKDRLLQNSPLLWNRVLNTLKERFHPTQTIRRERLLAFFFFLLNWL